MTEPTTYQVGSGLASSTATGLRLLAEAAVCRDVGAADMAALLEKATAELESLRRDAERYRWLRDNGEPDAGMEYRHDWKPEMYDAAIDAAMTGETR